MFRLVFACIKRLQYYSVYVRKRVTGKQDSFPIATDSV